jgi:hypothetical protein
LYAARFHHACGGRYTRIVNRSTRIVVGVLVALVMAGTPAVATACAMLCAAAVTGEPAGRSHEHDAHSPEAEVPAPLSASGQEHHHHDAVREHHRRDDEASPQGAGESTAGIRLTASSTHECCDDASVARLAATTRRDPGVSSPRTLLLPIAASPAAAITGIILDPATGPPFAPPQLSRPPLVLRI